MKFLILVARIWWQRRRVFAAAKRIQPIVMAECRAFLALDWAALDAAMQSHNNEDKLLRDMCSKLAEPRLAA